ncbi:MAG: hypothetical protein J6M60_05960 [Clostridia bacterium]|nr:hypothetical protein [Clostridia bacterium]
MTRELSIIERNAYSEVLEVLNNMTKDEVEKVPKDMIEMFKEFSNKEHKFKYDFSKRMDEQDFLKDTKLILAILYRDYWATPDRRKELLEKDKYNREKVEIEKRIKYNPNEIFKDKKEKNEKIEEVQTNAMIEHKESLIKRIINNIKKCFKKTV